MKITFLKFLFSPVFLVLVFLVGTKPVLAYPVVSTTIYVDVISLYEYSGNGNDSKGLNNSTDVNITYGEGKYGQGANFDGTAYISSPTTSFPFGALPRTIGTWFWNSSTAEQVLYRYGSRAGNCHWNGMETVDIGAGFKSYFNSGGTCGDMGGTIALGSSQWHSLIQQFDGTTTTVYIDNVLDKSNALALNTTNDVLFYRGADEGLSSKLNGRLDDTFILGRVLTDHEKACVVFATDTTCLAGGATTSTVPTSTSFGLFLDNHLGAILWIAASFLILALLATLFEVMLKLKASKGNF